MMRAMSPADAPGLVCVEERPFNAETPLERLTEIPTPTPLFYVRNHFDVPILSTATHELRIDGFVDRPASFSVPELREWDAREELVTFECAGNGRTVLKPGVPGTPWNWGAVSTGLFRGVPLSNLLDAAGVRDGACEVLFIGADQGEVLPGRIERFERSLPLSECARPDVIVAWEMNGAPLTAAHGAPLRLVVPGWYAVASVKWLTHIRVLRQPFRGFYQTERYTYQRDPAAADDTPVAGMRVRSLISSPADGAQLTAGEHQLSGIAWSGAATIAQVDVSIDSGRTWRAADLEPGQHAGVAQRWKLRATLPRGEHVLISRATDRAGQQQPLEPVWNALGYGNNGVQRVRVVVT